MSEAVVIEGLHEDVLSNLGQMSGHVAAALLTGRDEIVATRRLKHGGVIYEPGQVVPTVGQYGNDHRLAPAGGGRQYVTTRSEYEKSRQAHAERDRRLQDAMRGDVAAHLETQRTRAAAKVDDLGQKVKALKSEITKHKRERTKIEEQAQQALRAAPTITSRERKPYERDVLRPIYTELDRVRSALGRLERELVPLQAAHEAAQAEQSALDD